MLDFYPYLNDIDFLKKVAKSHIQTYYVKISVLNWKEQFVQAIEGRVISGSINIDGNSAIRRTLSLNVYIDNLINKITNVENLLSINKKFRAEIGVKNIFTQYSQYDTIWFPQGIFVISSCSVSNSDSGVTASIQAKDKMCLLNGECGGTFPATVVLDTYDTLDQNGQYITLRPTIYHIIQQLVNHFGGQQLNKIIISDLSPLVKKAVRWNDETTFYHLIGAKNTEQDFYSTNLEQITEKLDERTPEGEAVWIQSGSVAYGQDVGFVYTDFTWPASQEPNGENFICDGGTTIVDALNRIIEEVLGNYEFFYDIDGNFIFREVKNYLNNAQSKYISDAKNENELVPDYLDRQQISPYLIEINKGKSAISLQNDSDLIISYNNSPQYGTIKNDIMVWGIRKGLDNYQYPIRYHLAIDRKPKTGNAYYAFKVINDDNLEEWHATLSYEEEDSLPRPGVVGLYYLENSKKPSQENTPAEVTVKTWKMTDDVYDYVDLSVTIEKIVTKDWRTQLFLQGTITEPYGTDINYYYAELKNEWPKLYDIQKGQFRESTLKNPAGIDFYLDFIDPSSELAQLAVENIGRRTKVLNENKRVNCIFENDIPDIVFIKQSPGTETLPTGFSRVPSYDNNPKAQLQECHNRGQRFYLVPEVVYNSFATGGILNSAYQVVRQLLQEYVSYNETISIQCLPMYFLEPNIRITLFDETSNISGDYIINTMSYSFDISSTLTLNATRVLEKI